MKTITIENVGPNELLEIPLAEGGGVTVLRGRNDIGKSEGLKAVSALAGGGDKVSVRKDAPPGTKGKVSGCGVELTVFKSTRLKGVAEFEVLDGDFSIEDIVDPGVKDPVAADAKRIKALLRVSGASIEPSEFYDLVGGQDNFLAAVGPDETDPLVVASRVRAWLHKQATTLEKESEALANKAGGVEHAYAGVDVEAESDPAALRSEMEKAISNASVCETKRTAYLAAAEKWAHAYAQLADANASHDPKALAEATRLMRVAHEVHDKAAALVTVLRTQLKDAEKSLEIAGNNLLSAGQAESAALQNEKAIERLRSVVEAGRPEEVTEEAVAEAKAAVDKAREAVENGARVRDAKEKLASAKDMKKRAKALGKEAEACREKAGEVNGILNGAVEKLGVGLTVANERLIVERDGKQKLFEEISMGARRKVALDIAIDCIGEGGLITYGQDSWESLDWMARKEVHEHLLSRSVNMITAESDKTDDGSNGKVRATIYQP